jgi:hypothetical protein
MSTVAGQRQPDTSTRHDPLTVLTNLKEYMSPTKCPLLYEPYIGFFGDPESPQLPINLCEQQKKREGQWESGLMVMIQTQIFKLVAQFDGVISKLKGIVRGIYAKQRKLCMKNNGQHGDNAHRKIKSEEVGMALLRLCHHDELVVALEEAKRKGIEIDDIFDALNLLLSLGVELYAEEAKDTHPNPLETGAVVDGGKTFVRMCSSDPGEVLHAIVIADTSCLYPPHPGMTLYSNDSDEGKDVSKDVLMPLPAFRVLFILLVDLRNNKVIFKWQPEEPEKEPFYKPDTRDINDIIKEAEAVRKERIHSNRVIGAQKAAETRKRKKMEAAFGKKEADDVIEIKDEGDDDEKNTDTVERAKKRARVDDKPVPLVIGTKDSDWKYMGMTRDGACVELYKWVIQTDPEEYHIRLDGVVQSAWNESTMKKWCEENDLPNLTRE